MADHEALMLGTRGEETDEGIHEKQVLIGEGAENTVVTMTREMLGSRLQQIDDQTNDIDDHLPF
jgi:hypothetical protein